MGTVCLGGWHDDELALLEKATGSLYEGASALLLIHLVYLFRSAWSRACESSMT